MRAFLASHAGCASVGCASGVRGQVLVYDLAGLFGDSSQGASAASPAAHAAGRWKKLPLDLVRVFKGVLY